MKHAIQFNEDLYYLSMGLLVAVAVLAVADFDFFIRLNEAKLAQPTCASFSSYGEALQAYNAGDRRLDRNNNGFPCETLIK